MGKFETATLVAIVLYPALAIGQATTVKPTELEEFVSEPNVTFEERTIGRLVSLDSTIDLHVIQAQGPSVNSRMTGVRFDLRTSAWRDSVFLDIDQVTELLREMSLINSTVNGLDDPSHPLHNQVALGRSNGWF